MTLHLTNPLTKGSKVEEFQHALAAAHLLRPSETDGVYGPRTARAVEQVKWRLGYPPSEIHHGAEYAGQTLLDFLHGTTQLPAAYKQRRRARLGVEKPLEAPAKKETAEQRIRERIVAYCRWAIEHEPQIHYVQRRPMRGLGDLMQLPVSEDCSEFATKACRYGGAPDPNGSRYNGLGYTGTLLSDCRHITRQQAEPGDLVVFGAAPGHHVCVVLEPGADPLLASHGQERGPIAIRFSQEARYQSSSVAWLAVLP